MFYALNENVYLVTGKVRGCIYDFNNSKLYSLNNALTQKICLANEGKLNVDAADMELKIILQHFIDLGILVVTKSHKTHFIDEIASAAPSDKFAWIEITNRCNLRCRHCYNESDSGCNSVMSMQDYKKVVNALLSLGVDKIQIIGGEPFLEARILKEMLQYSVGKFNFIEVFTNGTLITADWIDFLAENKIHVALSVYSYESKMHDAVTNCRGSWAKTNRIIAELKGRGVPYRVCNVLMRGLELGAKTGDLYDLYAHGDVVRMSGRANFALLSDALIRKQLITKDTFKKPIAKKFCASLLAGHNCFRKKLYISADLDVFPCVMERRRKHCSLRESQDIKLDESLLKLSKDDVQECCSCEYRYACFDCRPNSLSGNFLEQPWYCTYQPSLGTWEDCEVFIAKLKDKWS